MITQKELKTLLSVTQKLIKKAKTDKERERGFDLFNIIKKIKHQQKDKKKEKPEFTGCIRKPKSPRIKTPTFKR